VQAFLGRLGVAACAVVYFRQNAGSIPMRVLGAGVLGASVLGASVLGAAAMIALLAGPPAFAQMPKMNLLQDMPSKSQEEKDADAERDKAYKESLKKIPDAKTSSDPWGSVRTTDAPKASAPAKPRTKTGSTAN
jgi:hypothetical protein